MSSLKDTVKSKLSALSQMISSLRFVKAGDYVLSEDHNAVVDVLKKMEDVINDLLNYAESIKTEVQEYAARASNCLLPHDDVTINDFVAFTAKGLEEELTITDEVEFTQS